MKKNKKQKTFYLLEFHSDDLVFTPFSEIHSSKIKAVDALNKYALKYRSPWGRVLKVTQIIAEINNNEKA